MGHGRHGHRLRLQQWVRWWCAAPPISPPQRPPWRLCLKKGGNHGWVVGLPSSNGKFMALGFPQYCIHSIYIYTLYIYILYIYTIYTIYIHTIYTHYIYIYSVYVCVCVWKISCNDIYWYIHIFLKQMHSIILPISKWDWNSLENERFMAFWHSGIGLAIFVNIHDHDSHLRIWQNLM